MTDSPEVDIFVSQKTLPISFTILNNFPDRPLDPVFFTR